MAIIEYFICFAIFVPFQSIAINGIFECFREGMIFYGARIFLSKYIDHKWQKPLWGCIRCMASVWGTITFWITALLFFGYDGIEWWVWIFDLLILVSLNNYFLKKL